MESADREPRERLPAAGAADLPGVALVTTARRQLAVVDTMPLSERVDAFDAVHRLLQDALAAVETQLQGDRMARP